MEQMQILDLKMELLCTGGVDFVTGGFGGGAANIAGDADLGQLLTEMGMEDLI